VGAADVRAADTGCSDCRQGSCYPDEPELVLSVRFDDLLIAYRLSRWPKKDQMWLRRLRRKHPSEAQLVYDLILELDARPVEDAVHRRRRLRRRSSSR